MKMRQSYCTVEVFQFSDVCNPEADDSFNFLVQKYVYGKIFVEIRSVVANRQIWILYRQTNAE